MRKLATHIARMTPLALVVLGLVFSVVQVARTCINQTPGKRATIDFLWPTFTPQKVRYGEYLAQRYMELHPDVAVNLILTPDPGRKLQVMIAGRTAPDVAWCGVGWEQFSDALMPLDDFIARDGTVRPEDFQPRLWQAMQWQGSVRALPSSGQTAVIFYNKDLFDNAGLPYPTKDWTWEDMERMAKALTRDFDGDGTIDQYGLQLGQVYLVPFLLYGGQMADPAWKEARIDTPINRAVLARYQALMYGEQPVMPTPSASAELGMLPMFEAGRVAMHAASSYAIETFRGTQFDWDIVEFPAFVFNGQHHRATGFWQEEFGVLWDTNVPQDAWDFIKFCAGEDMVRWAALNGHIVPGRIDVAHSDAYLHSGKRPANMSAFIDSQDFAVPVYPHPWYRRMGLDLTKVEQQFSIGSEGKRLTPEETAQAMQLALQKVLDEYQSER